MSRHTDIPPFARTYGRNHPAVQGKILAEVEQDLRGTYEPARREVLGHFEDREYISHKARIEHERYGWKFYDVLAVVSLITVVAVFALGAAWCLMA